MSTTLSTFSMSVMVGVTIVGAVVVTWVLLLLLLLLLLFGSGHLAHLR